MRVVDKRALLWHATKLIWVRVCLAVLESAAKYNRLNEFGETRFDGAREVYSKHLRAFVSLG